MSVQADDPTASEPVEQPALDRARAFYVSGVEHVRQAKWAEALDDFERSRALRPHPMTTYNIGACERALGNYTRAREQLSRALAEDLAGELPAVVTTDARAFLDEIERILVHLSVLVEPAGTAIDFDGRPLLEQRGEGGRRRFVAGVLPPGPARVVPAGELEIEANPGVHVITLSHKGYADVLVNRNVTPGQQLRLRWVLSQLPAAIHVSSNERGALVRVGGHDVGLAPVDLMRPAGTYHVEVSKPGFARYEADVRASAGQESSLRVRLEPERLSPMKTWWFWTAAAVVVGGVATTTFFATRSAAEPERPPLDGGSLGWVAHVR